MRDDLMGVEPSLREHLKLRDDAAGGDLKFTLSPATTTRAATAAAWTRTVKIYLKSTDGRLHDWFNGSIASCVSIADTSTAGTATIASTTVTFVKGVGSVTISGDAAAWLATETNTLTVATDRTLLDHTISATAVTSVETITA